MAHAQRLYDAEDQLLIGGLAGFAGLLLNPMTTPNFDLDSVFPKLQTNSWQATLPGHKRANVL